MNQKKSLIQTVKNWVAPAVVAVSLSTGLYAAQTYSINIASQQAGAALMALARETGVQIIVSQDVGENVQVDNLRGEYTLNGALENMLNGTGLAYEITPENVVLVKMADAVKPGGDNKEASTKSSYINEIIVTAEKREQNLQEVPVAISAFSAEMISARGISTPQDLQFSVPGLMIGEQNNTGGTAKATIRGVGSENFQPGGDPGVPLHINGHYTQSTAYVFRDMIDVERVEVQRGPQGTLYGRNAIGGNINIITKRPTEEFEGSIGVEVGNFNKRQIQAVVSGPLGDRLRGRLVVADASRDGFVEDLGVYGGERDSVDYTSVRAALEADLSDEISVYVNTYYFDDKGNTYTRQLNTDPNNIANFDPWKVRYNTPTENVDESKGISIDINWDLGAVEFRSLSAYDDTLKNALNDTDASDSVRRVYGNEIGYKTYTQEFQLLSAGEDNVQWVAGLFYYDEESVLRSYPVIIPLTTTSVVFDRTDTVNATSMAAYGQVDYSLSDDLVVVAGLRYTKDEKDRFALQDVILEDGSSGPIFGGAYFAPTFGDILRDNRDGDDWSEVTGKLGLNYYYSQDAMYYVSWSRGYKAGGYGGAQDPAYDPEYVDAYEAGLKSQWLDNSLQINLAGFYYKYKDKQDFQRYVDSFGVTHFEILNAADAISYGLEMEFQAYISENFSLDGSIAYLNAEFDEFVTIDATFPLADPDRSGNKLPLSPDWKFNLGVQYDWALDGNAGELSLRGDYVWVDDQYGNAFNREGDMLPGSGDLIPSYHFANARLQWENADASWRAELYVKNLTNEEAISNSFVVNASSVFVSNLAPRTYGLKVNYQF